METLAWIVAAAATAVALALGFRLWQAHRREAALNERLAADDQTTRALAASQERARIAREMHDIVAHTLSVVVAQADGGQFAAAKDPAAAKRSLETIADVGRSALAEMRALLGVLRESDGDAALGPQPSLADVPTLVKQLRDGGLDVSYVTTGTPVTLPIGAGLALYRIAQESLTNVIKHAGPKVKVIVQFRWSAQAVELSVTDDGRGAAAHSDGTGVGVEGMRERAVVFGGALNAGPKAGGGYKVLATMPITPRAAEETP